MADSALIDFTSHNIRVVKAHPQPKRHPVHYSHRAHTGKRLPFHQTSFALIFFVILFTVGCLLFVRHTIVSSLVETGDIQLSGLVSGPPPSTPANIQQPINEARFSDNSATIRGTCEHDYIIEVYRNGVLAGSAVCTPLNTFLV